MLRGNFRNRRTSMRRRGARAPESASESHQPLEQASAPKADPIVAYMEKNNSCFQQEILQPIKAMFANTREVRNYVVTSSEIQQNHPDLVDKVRSMDDEAWKILSQTKIIDRRFRTQVEKVKKKTAKAARFETKPKSVARKNAGKLKAAFLTTRNKTFKDAVEALKAEGYKGSLKIKKGMPVHNKMVELQKAQAASASTARSSSDTSGPK